MKKQRFALLTGTHKFTTACKQEVRVFWALRGSDVRRDRPLVIACQKEIDSLCPNIPAGKGLVFRCLKSKKSQLGEQCSSVVSTRQAEVGPS